MASNDFVDVLENEASSSKRHRETMFCPHCNRIVSKSTFYRHRLLSEHESSGQVPTEHWQSSNSPDMIVFDDSSEVCSGHESDNLTAEATCEAINEDIEEGILALNQILICAGVR